MVKMGIKQEEWEQQRYPFAAEQYQVSSGFG